MASTAINGPGGPGCGGDTAWKIRSSVPSSVLPLVIGSKCGSFQPDDDTRPRALTISMPPPRGERRTSMLVTIRTGTCMPSAVVVAGASPPDAGGAFAAPGCDGAWPGGACALAPM